MGRSSYYWCLWSNEYDQYIVNTDLTSGMEDEAEYDILSVRGLTIQIFDFYIVVEECYYVFIKKMLLH